MGPSFIRESPRSDALVRSQYRSVGAYPRTVMEIDKPHLTKSFLSISIPVRYVTSVNDAPIRRQKRGVLQSTASESVIQQRCSKCRQLKEKRQFIRRNGQASCKTCLDCRSRVDRRVNRRVNRRVECRPEAEMAIVVEFDHTPDQDGGEDVIIAEVIEVGGRDQPDIVRIASLEQLPDSMEIDSVMLDDQSLVTDAISVDELCCSSTNSRCQHGRQKRQCKECGTGYCQHGQQKSQCKDCGTGYCQHGRLKRRCKDCGTGYCEHGRLKS